MLPPECYLFGRAGVGAPHFAHGMCKDCYEQYLDVTGGTSQGADPPAFTASLAPKVGPPQLA
jgi:hypothetical protein